MTNLEKKIDLLIRYSTEDNKKAKKQLLEELKELIQAEPENPAPNPVCIPKPIDDSSDKLYDVIEDILNELGVPHHLVGRNYAACAINLIISNEKYASELTKGLYPEVASSVGSTASRVERAIRHAVETTWDRGDTEVFMKHFGNTIDRDKAKPTNGEFLACCARIVRRRMRDSV